MDLIQNGFRDRLYSYLSHSVIAPNVCSNVNEAWHRVQQHVEQMTRTAAHDIFKTRNGKSCEN